MQHPGYGSLPASSPSEAGAGEDHRRRIRVGLFRRPPTSLPLARGQKRR